jgi:glucose-1-phosphate thymidylyltransferase
LSGRRARVGYWSELTGITFSTATRGDLAVEIFGRGFAWLDTGTHASLMEAAHFIQILEERQGMHVCCPEEIALKLGYISLDTFGRPAERCAKSSYGEYLIGIHKGLAR